MPRSRSSGALSIWSYARNFANPFFVNTFVIAAVSVVFPWSTCPIVRMFRCGLFRMNFSLAIWLLLCCASHALQHRLSDLARNRRVALELHRVRRPPLGHRTDIGREAEHGGKRH